jgi:hypothetical protein
MVGFFHQTERKRERKKNESRITTWNTLGMLGMFGEVNMEIIKNLHLFWNWILKRIKYSLGSFFVKNVWKVLFLEEKRYGWRQGERILKVILLKRPLLFARELTKSLCLSQKFKNWDFSKVLPRFEVLSGTKIWNMAAKNQDCIMWTIFSTKKFILTQMCLFLKKIIWDHSKFKKPCRRFYVFGT